ncbi:major facilitator superfamily MFS_1 [Sphingobium chlorophenolicum L-1]|uniref:Major facilitator superfamily MFS_1 n=1 Tax=Sphingobium chlorophenolicum L-1 TaxID=690566 RepID=F6EWB2_SPHCR|nr:MFS transporter [Sphingobium chlorophenolicum]AEG49806.1 major facilitator superfamily MFS_1 [Sphingobium chlorophenolicum L-1]
MKLLSYAPNESNVKKVASYAWYVAVLLSFAHIVSIMDRYLLSVVLEDVKRALSLTDTELGVLQGPAFVLSFALASIPLGRLSDLANRKWIIVGAVSFWSAATLACAFAQSFTELLIARLAVGLGEAALMPAAVSIIVALFSEEKRTQGISIFTAGSSLGRAAGFSLGGAILGWSTAAGPGARILIDLGFAPWQTVFLAGGAAGIVLTLALILTLHEPARARVEGPRPSFADALSHFYRNKAAYLSIFLPFAMFNAIVQMLGAWSVSFYVRKFEITAAEAGALVGTIVLIAGPAGHLFGGWLNDRLARNSLGVQPMILLVILALSPLFILAFTMAPTVTAAAAGFMLFYTVGAITGPTSYAGCQIPTPDAHRGSISAIFLTFFTLVGFGLGPLVVGIVGDRLFPGDNSLGSAMQVCTVVFAGIGVLIAFLGRPAFIRAAEDARRTPVDRPQTVIPAQSEASVSI